MTEAEAAALVCERMMAAKKGAGASFAVVDEQAADRLLGSTGLFSIDRQRCLGVVAYWLAPPSRGKGIATRAVSTLCEWAFLTVGLARLELRVDVRNEPSQRLPSAWASCARAPSGHPKRSTESESTSTSTRSCPEIRVSAIDFAHPA